MKTFVVVFFSSLVCIAVLSACKNKGVSSKVASDFSLEIFHSGCRGTCPVYSIQVDGKGNAKYNGRYSVELMGDYTKTLEAKTVEALSQAINDAHFWDFQDEYGGGVADLPSVRTTVTMDGKTKSVHDIREAPKELRELEAKLEELIGEAGWKKIE
jgi:hypothetical protein